MQIRAFSRIFFPAICISILVSCATDINISGPDDPVIYPPPPDSTRIQYLTSISTSADIKGKQSSINKFLFGEETPLPIIKPYGIAVNGSKIYICDTGLGGLVIIDLSKRDFKYFTPGGKGQLQLPLNCHIDENGYLFVADGNREQIVVFDSSGKYFAEFGETLESFRPTDISVSGDTVYVASIKDQLIYVFEKSTFRLLKKFPELEPEDDGYLYQPVNIFADERFLYVSDMGDNKLKIFTHSGRYLFSTGGYGNHIGRLMRPKGVAADKQSNIYIVDAAFENVQIFNSDGQVLMSFGGPYARHGDMYLPADVTISYSGLDYFQEYVDDSFILKYLIFVTNQYGPDKISIYGFVKER